MDLLLSPSAGWEALGQQRSIIFFFFLRVFNKYEAGSGSEMLKQVVLRPVFIVFNSLSVRLMRIRVLIRKTRKLEHDSFLAQKAHGGLEEQLPVRKC